MTTIRIVAAVVDTRQLKLYKEDCSIVVIPQGDPRLRRVLEQATPQLQANKQADGSTWADVDIAEAITNDFADFQEKSVGVRFFRVAKAALSKLFGSELGPDTTPVRPQYHGMVPAAPVPPSPAATSAPATPVAVATAPVAEDTSSLTDVDLAKLESWEPKDTDALDKALEDAAVTGTGIVAVDSDGDAVHVPVNEVMLGDERMDGFDKSDDAQDTARDEAAAAAEVPDAVAGQDEQAETFEPVVQVPETKVEQTMSVVDEIIAHAIPVTDPKYNEDGIVKQRPMAVGGVTENSHPDESSEDTIIAVVGDKVIPDVELIKSQFGHAAGKGSTIGMENFMKRLAGVIEQRSHSVKDLLRFMERADLPVADDGTIIIYKILRRRGDKYVDCHSQNVQQWVGAYVCMDPSLVDHNRNHECSNGLHVARRGYIGHFGGDVCVVAKLAPEDVITIPAYDANKMRVCGYHILKELPADLYAMLRSNKPITNTDEGKRILADVIAGKHIRKTHEVRITGHMGAGVITKEYPKDVEPAPVLKPVVPEVVALPEDHKLVDEPLVPAAVAEHIEKALSKREQAKVLYDAWTTAPEVDKADRLAALVNFKKDAKKSWDVLGITDPAVTGVAPASKAAPTVKVVETKKVAPAPVKQALPAASDGSPRERITKLLTLGLNKDVAQKVYDIKKASKKSWDVLGVSSAHVVQIMKLIGKE